MWKFCRLTERRAVAVIFAAGDDVRSLRLKKLKAEFEKAETGSTGLLTIFQSDAASRATDSPLQALESLQKHLRLDAARAAEWMTTVREARR